MEIQPTKENKSSKLDKLVKISIIVGALIVALSAAYYLVIFLPSKEKNRINLEDQRLSEEKEKESKQSQALFRCLTQMEMLYYEDWNNACKMMNLKNGCSLPSDTAHDIEQRLKEDKNDCFKRFPQN